MSRVTSLSAPELDQLRHQLATVNHERREALTREAEAKAELETVRATALDLAAKNRQAIVERDEAKAEAQRLAEKVRDLLRRNTELRQRAELGNVVSKEAFEECENDAAVYLDEYELGKFVLEAVKEGRQKLRDGECVYVAIDLPRSFKVTGDEGFPGVTAARVDDPERSGVAYEIFPG
jgi:uncharacterized protein (DUF3084 family)